MAGLTRTDLTTLDKVHLAASAVALQDEYGAVSRLARKFGLSRHTVYAAQEEAVEVLHNYFEPGGRAGVRTTVAVDEGQLRRAVVALRVMGHNSVRAIEDLLPVLYPGLRVSYGKVQGLLVEAEKRAAEFNLSVDLSAIKAGALDEMFSQRSPVLAGVDLDSKYLFALEKRSSRSGEDWAAVLRGCKRQGLELEQVVKDAALGIKAGVQDVFPKAEQRDDCFHAHYEMGKQTRRMGAKAYGAIAAEQAAQRAIRKVRLSRNATLERRRSLDIKLGQAKRRCQHILEQHDTFETAVSQVREGMEVVDLETGTLRTPEQMERMITNAAKTMKSMDHDKCRKVGRYIANRAPGLVLYATALRNELHRLAERHSREQVQLACIVLRLVADLRRGWHPWRRIEDQRHLLATYGLLENYCGRVGANEIMRAVAELLRRRHRASSAIEGFNAALRPHLYIHKGVTQGFLDLFQAYYNLRRRRWGHHKGTSAYEGITGRPVADWLAVLGYEAGPGCHAAMAA